MVEAELMEDYNVEDAVAAGTIALCNVLKWLREASEANTGASALTREPDATESLRGSNGLD